MIKTTFNNSQRIQIFDESGPLKELPEFHALDPSEQTRLLSEVKELRVDFPPSLLRELIKIRVKYAKKLPEEFIKLTNLCGLAELQSISSEFDAMFEKMSQAEIPRGYYNDLVTRMERAREVTKIPFGPHLAIPMKLGLDKIFADAIFNILDLPSQIDPSQFITKTVLDPCNVVIIGGGPAGWATAIGASEWKARVCIIEKRESHSREQWLVLTESSLRLLGKWEVSPLLESKWLIAPIGIGHGENEIKKIVPIKALEDALETRAIALGAKKIQGEFLRVHPKKRTVDVLIGDSTVEYSYDFLVGADGAHSRVKDALGIGTHCMGKAIGAGAALQTNSFGPYNVRDIIFTNTLFARIITTPYFSFFFMQRFPQVLDPITQQDFARVAHRCGWQSHFEKISKGEGRYFEHIPVVLQQAETFAKPDARAIIIGDAAACGSFYQGMNANTALKTAVFAEECIRKVRARDPAAYEAFNQQMKAETDQLLSYSQPLFNQE